MAEAFLLGLSFQCGMQLWHLRVASVQALTVSSPLAHRIRSSRLRVFRVHSPAAKGFDASRLRKANEPQRPSVV